VDRHAIGVVLQANEAEEYVLFQLAQSLSAAHGHPPVADVQEIEAR
jgi:hypothetical protein